MKTIIKAETDDNGVARLKLESWPHDNLPCRVEHYLDSLDLLLVDAPDSEVVCVVIDYYANTIAYYGEKK